jgi:hypothetical protein
LVEKAQGDASKILEVAGAQRVGERQHLESARHALYLGVEHEANTAHGFENALRSVLTVLFIVSENDAGRENNQRQRGSRNQKSKTQWQRGLRHAGPELMHLAGERQVMVSIGEAPGIRQAF